MGLFDFLGFGKKAAKIQEFMERGAAIIDVRSSSEFSSGHIRGAYNIPLDSIQHKIDKIKKLNKPVITCCASGIRSAGAAGMLKQHGIETINGGGWSNLQSKIS